MRVLIAGAATMTLAAAAAAALALHGAPTPAPQAAPAAEAVPPDDAVPGLVWRSGTVTVRLTDRPCPSEDLARVLEVEGVTRPLAYEVTQKGRRSTGCWSKDLAGDVVTMEPGREVGSIPVAWFRQEAGG